MGLRDVTGVLSRYFIVGYWVPAFFAFSIVAAELPRSWTPTDYNNLPWLQKSLVLGALGLLLGLLSLGLRYPITRGFEGYWPERWPLRLARRGLVALQLRRRDRIEKERDDENSSDAVSTRAAVLLDRQFHSDRAKALPTRFGNAYRACENYSYTRYGLDGIALWPRIDQLLTQQERELHLNAESDLAFFMNGALAAVAVGITSIAVWGFSRWWAYVPFIVSYLLYRFAAGAVERVGTERRASIDLHRLELYQRLGLVAPASPEEERTTAKAVNQLLLYGISSKKDESDEAPVH